MSKLSWWKRAFMLIGVGLIGSAIVVGQPRLGSSAEPPTLLQDADKNLYRGSGSCKACHGIRDNPAYNYAKGFVKMDEFTTWKEQDKHTLAFSNLLSPRGKKMASLLGIADVTNVKAGCIGCHGAGEAEAKNRTEGDLFDPNEGVSCENCHGPSSRWWAPHVDTSFRPKTTEEREKIGLIDLRSPVRQADQCLTCHIGNAGEGKVVTHEMYAAGHPPLPSIEVATFSDIIPRHWWLLSEKPSDKIRQLAGYKGNERDRTRLAIVGAAVALQTSMRLLADETLAKGNSTVPGLDWPDFARFDCWSCHHDLKRESWRQARGYQAAPGRPPISEWPLAMVELGIDRLEMDDPSAGAFRAELQGHRKAVLERANARPFGQKVAMAAAANQFARWSDVLIKRLAGATYTDEIALKLLRKLLAKADERVTDYDAARHVAWTIKILVEDAGARLTNRPAIDAVLKKLDDGLKLDLPAGRGYEIEDQLSKALQVIGDYEPSEFREHLKELAGLLPPTP